MREGIIESFCDVESGNVEPRPETFYVSPSHLKDLRLDTRLIIGRAGTGKSYLAAALQSKSMVEVLSFQLPELKGIEVYTGFSAVENIACYPNAEVFNYFISNDGSMYDLWRAVMVRWVADRSGREVPVASWRETAIWVQNNKEAVRSLMMHGRDWRGLIIFDALDSIDNDWIELDAILQGLMKAIVWIKQFAGLYGKVFLTDEQAKRPIFNFPDAPIMRSTMETLSWSKYDLHGLLWHRLVNMPGEYGALARRICAANERDGLWMIDGKMKISAKAQRECFDLLAGGSMGKGRYDGVPYDKVFSRLLDSQGRVLPRTFLASIYQAALDTKLLHPDHEYVLHHECIKTSIIKAAEVQIDTMVKGYPWICQIFSKLRGAYVPCSYDEFVRYWRDDFIIDVQDDSQYLKDICEDLQYIGVISIRNDGRIDMPELYRIGLNMGRRGGNIANFNDR